MAPAHGVVADKTSARYPILGAMAPSASVMANKSWGTHGREVFSYAMAPWCTELYVAKERQGILNPKWGSMVPCLSTWKIMELRPKT